MRSLPLFHNIAGQKVIVLGEGPMAEPKRRLVERAGGVVVGEADPDARLAFLALDDPEPVAGRLKARGLLVNVVDRPDLCDFTVPSILERDPVLVAVGTSGKSAGLAKQLRLRLEALLPQSLGQLALRLGEARGKLKAKIPDAADRRQALDQAMSAGGLLDPLGEDSADAVDAWLEEPGKPSDAAHAIITITSADPDDLTLRQARLLASADVLLIAEGVSEAILARARADALRRDLPFDGDLSEGLIVQINIIPR
jgi:uroporphyrin-III C-methyltransferase/precorrin-2 dehydrogenase/sirohydrochlorin ferrochelatase